MQTAVEWLINELGEYFPHEIGGIHLMVEQAKEMEKQQIIDAIEDGRYEFGYEYYRDTYGSKGSVFLEGYEQINQDNPVTRGSTALVRVTSSQTEISDEEIEKAGTTFHWDFRGATELELSAFIFGAKWYREQLKKKQ